MLGLRRASLPLRSRVLSIRVCSPVCGNTEQFSTMTCDQSRINDSSEFGTGRCLCFTGLYCNKHTSASLSLVRRGFATGAGSKKKAYNSEELENGFSELESDDSNEEIPKAKSSNKGKGGVVSESEFSEFDDDDDDDVGNDIDATDAGLDEKVALKSWRNSELFSKLRSARPSVVSNVLNDWAKEGHTLDHSEISGIIYGLQNYKMFTKALTFSEWLERSQTIVFTEKDYAVRIRLISKVSGLVQAEKYVDRIPELSKGVFLYQSFLVSCVQAQNQKKSEEIFNKIKSEFKLTSFDCNQMIYLYQRVDKSKVSTILSLMEKNSIKPTLYTYGLLITSKAQQHDIAGMEKIIEMMKSEGHEPTLFINYKLAVEYVASGSKEKAEAIAEEMEGDGLGNEKNREACQSLMRLYGELGRGEDVERVWKVCSENKPWRKEYMAAIESFGKAKRVDKAEEVFEKLLDIVKNPIALHYDALLKVYVANGMTEKGTGLVKRMAENSVNIGKSTVDSLVKLYIAAGELEKANSVLLRAAGEQKSLARRPLIMSFMAVMEAYAKKGDAHNAEKIFAQMKETGYNPRYHQFQTLIKAYENGKTPVYGMKERMKADNFIPGRGISIMLDQVNPFKKTAITDLID